MKKFFTYLFASAAFCMIGTVNAMAQDDEVVEDDLLPDMFMNWTDPETPTAASGGCAYVVGEQTGMPYGDGNVAEFLYADLSDYDYLKAETTGVFARVFMNRIGDNGLCSAEFDVNTEAIDGNTQWVKDRYYTIDEGEGEATYIVNLKKIVEDFGYAHLNGIKFPWNGGGNICETLVVGKGSLPTGVKEIPLKEVLAGQRFNVAGQKVGNNAKGLYIMNGKKYIK